MNNEDRCLAWQQMRRQRHCPSLKVLQQGGPQAEQHLASCPHCRLAMKHAAETAGLGQMLLNLPLHQPPASAPVPGDVRSLRPSVDPSARVDAGGTYYNPPLLLVLSRPNAFGCVRVAQIFDEPELQDAGDVPLTSGLIAEAWNTYDVPCSALHPVPYTQVNQQAVEAVLEAAKGPFPAIDEFTPLFSFRSDECRTGSFFSLPLNQENLRRREEAEAKPARTCRIHYFSTTQSVHNPADIKNSNISIQLGRLLATPCPSADLALAAADALNTDPRPSQRIAVTVSRPDQKDGAPCACAAELRTTLLHGKTQCSIDCRIPSPLPLISYALQCGDAEPLEAEAFWLDKELLRIDAVFDGEFHTPDELRAAIILSEEEPV